jgi:hypothetical protein
MNSHSRTNILLSPSDNQDSVNSNDPLTDSEIEAYKNMLKKNSSYSSYSMARFCSQYYHLPHSPPKRSYESAILMQYSICRAAACDTQFWSEQVRYWGGEELPLLNGGTVKVPHSIYLLIIIFSENFNSDLHVDFCKKILDKIKTLNLAHKIYEREKEKSWLDFFNPHSNVTDTFSIRISNIDADRGLFDTLGNIKKNEWQINLDLDFAEISKTTLKFVTNAP